MSRRILLFSLLAFFAALPTQPALAIDENAVLLDLLDNEFTRQWAEEVPRGCPLDEGLDVLLGRARTMDNLLYQQMVQAELQVLSGSTAAEREALQQAADAATSRWRHAAQRAIMYEELKSQGARFVSSRVVRMRPLNRGAFLILAKSLPKLAVILSGGAFVEIVVEYLIDPPPCYAAERQSPLQQARAEALRLSGFGVEKKWREALAKTVLWSHDPAECGFHPPAIAAYEAMYREILERHWRFKPRNVWKFDDPHGHYEQGADPYTADPRYKSPLQLRLEAQERLIRDILAGRDWSCGDCEGRVCEASPLRRGELIISRLDEGDPALVNAIDCVPVEVRLDKQTGSGVPFTALKPTSISLDDGQGGHFYETRYCSTRATEFTVPVGAATITAWYRPQLDPEFGSSFSGIQAEVVNPRGCYEGAYMSLEVLVPTVSFSQPDGITDVDLDQCVPLRATLLDDHRQPMTVGQTVRFYGEDWNGLAFYNEDAVCDDRHYGTFSIPKGQPSTTFSLLWDRIDDGHSIAYPKISHSKCCRIEGWPFYLNEDPAEDPPDFDDDFDGMTDERWFPVDPNPGGGDGIDDGREGATDESWSTDDPSGDGAGLDGGDDGTTDESKSAGEAERDVFPWSSYATP